MTKLGYLTLAAAIALTPGWAAAWRAQNGHDVLAVSEGVFEVLARPGSGPREFWCAAGDYAYGLKRVAAAQRIYVLRGRGPSETQSGRIAVQFSYAPPQGVELRDSPFFSMKKPGDSLVAGAAQQYCYDYEVIP